MHREKAAKTVAETQASTPAKTPRALRSIEIFVGAGGLGLGLAQTGFRHELVVDQAAEACRTIRHNQDMRHPLVDGWRVVEADARLLDLSGVAPEPDLLAGGVPCQPWSIGGKHAGKEDERDMWPTAVRVVRELAPRAFVFENVPAMATMHADYFAYVQAMLANPGNQRRKGEEASSHATRLVADAKGRSGLHYRVGYAVMEARDYGTAQCRRRLFTVGLRSETTTAWSAPQPTHSSAELFQDQWVTGRYWSSRGLRPPVPTARTTAAVRTMGSNSQPFDLFQTALPRAPHRTMRDAIGDMPEPRAIAPHNLPGHIRATRQAKAYGTRHAGAGLDEPAKTLRAGVHGVSGGSSMLIGDDGLYRHFTVREAARLQDFPDDYEIWGSWSAGLRQLGNAVPCKLASAVGSTLALALS